jgi:hypothetical protein
MLTLMLTNDLENRNISEIIDQMTVVRFEMLSKVAPDLLTKKGIIVYPNILMRTNPMK